MGNCAGAFYGRDHTVDLRAGLLSDGAIAGGRGDPVSQDVSEAIEFPPHCSAIAAAIPGKVRLRSFHLSALGGSFQTLPSRPPTTLLGTSLGRFFNQRQVAFVSPCP